MACKSLLFLLLTAAIAPSTAEVSNTDANANPIRRVVSLLQGMAKKVAAEGEKEKDLYEKFMCYCKTSGGDLQEAISGSTAKVPALQSDIESSQASLKQTKLDLKSHQEDRSAAKAAMASATSQREKDNAKYVAESDELKSYVSALAGSIPAIEKGMSGTFLQAKVGQSLNRAVQNSEQTTEYDKNVVFSFLSGAAQEGYVPKGGEIVGILKTMKADFAKNLAGVEEEEAGAVKTYDELMAAKMKQVEALTSGIEKKSVKVGELQVSIVSMKNDLTETEAALIADQKFAADMETSCKTKKAEMDERVKTRGEELVAIAETIKILNDDDALELFKKTLPSASLLQLKASSEKVRSKAQRIVLKLRSSMSGRPELDLLAMALTGRSVDFTKVVKMIDDMVALLKTEQVDDEHKKEYCDMQLGMAEDKAKELQGKVEDLTVSIEEKEGLIKQAAEDIKALTAGVKKLDKAVSDATYQRKQEHDEFVELMSSNNAAKELMNFAKTRLNKFYKPAAATEEAASFVQIREHSSNKDEPAAPPPTFSGDYKKKSGESSGVINMIDLLIRDLDKEMTEAQTDENASQQDYEHMMDDSAKKRAADSKSIAVKGGAKAEAEEGKVADEGSKAAEFKELTATKQYESNLHSECDWLIQNYDLRRSMRTQEMDNLSQAKAILSGADFSLLQSQAKALPARHLRGL